MGVWTDKKIEQLKELWKEGIPTAEIGKRLDFSKNAIVGKVNRLGLEHRTSPIKTASSKAKTPQDNVKKPQSTDDTNKVAQVKSTPVKKEDIAPVDIMQPREVQSQSTSVGVRLIDLTSDRCCWPVDEDSTGEFHFCGKKVFKGKPYCLEHCVMAYTNSSALKEKDKSSI